MYIRFIVGTDSEDPRKLHGPFTELEYLRKNRRLESYEEEVVEEIFNTFNAELPCPPWDSSDWPVDSISWFKESGQGFISKMYCLVAILADHGIPVRVLKCRHLFKVLYEDGYQVVAIDKRF